MSVDFAKRNFAIRYSLFVILLVAAYWPSLSGDFLWDDDAMLLRNPLISADDGLRRIWFSTEPVDYFPLVYSSFWLEWRMWGDDPAAYRIVNLLLHAGAAFLLFHLLRELQVRGAQLAALLFALHPVCVESVAWITERKNTLPMVFYLASIWSYLLFDRTSRRGWYVLALVAFFAALLGKTSVVVLPFAVLIALWWRHGRITSRSILNLLPFFILAAALAGVSLWFQQHRAIGETAIRTDGWASRLIGAGQAVWFYLGKALLPLHLSFVYELDWRALDPASLRQWLPLAALAAALLLLGRARHAVRGTWSCTLYFLLSLLPVLGFADIYFMRYAIVTDHWQYVALPGILVWLAAAYCRRVGIDDVGENLAPPSLRQAARPTLRKAELPALAVLLLLGVATFQRSRMFQSTEALLTDALAANPRAWMAHANLGNIRIDEGDAERGLLHFQSAVDICPDDAATRWNYGGMLARVGRLDEALQECTEAVRLAPNVAHAHNNLAAVYVLLQRWEEAADAYRRVLQLAPDYPEARENLARVLEQIGNGGA